MKLIVVATRKDINLFLENLEKIHNYLGCEIIVVTQADNLNVNIHGVTFIDENKLVPNLTYKNVESAIMKRWIYDNKPRVGWYFQQFLKMGYARSCKDDYYMVWDADTVPLKKIDLFDEAGKPYFNLKEEYNSIYFDVIRDLLYIEKKEQMSFISENMIFKCAQMNELLNRIEENEKILGEYYWEKIINSIKIENLRFNAFSEFETYGTYISNYYPNLYVKRKFNSFRFGNAILGNKPSESQLLWAAQEYDAIAFEKWDFTMPIIPIILRSEMGRKIISPLNAAKIAEKWRRFYREGCGKKILDFIKLIRKTLKRKLIKYE